MPLSVHFLFLAISLVMLWKGADWLVESASRIAIYFGIDELIVGLTIVSIGTSAPEFAVTVGAALQGLDSVSLGNVIGSNIFNLGIVLGGSAMITPIEIPRRVITRDGPFLLFATGGLLVALYDMQLSQVEGFVMFGLLIVYLVLLFARREPLEEVEVDHPATIWDGPLLLLGLVFVVGGAQMLINSATVLAEAAGLSQWFIAITIVAGGTSLPELVTSFMAASRGKFGLCAGNLVGSDVFNVLGVLGVAGAIRGINVERSGMLGLVLMVVFLVGLLVLIRVRPTLHRKEGMLLIGVALARWIIGALT